MGSAAGICARSNGGMKPCKILIPAMADGAAQLFAAAFRAVGFEAEITPASDARTLELGGRYTCGDECLPAKVTVGDFMKVLEDPRTDPSRIVLFMPSADGPCRFGQYAPYLRNLLDRSEYRGVRILSPNCEDGYSSLGLVAARFFRLAWRAVVAADLIEKLLLTVRPYETRKGAADRAFRESIEEMSRAVESAPLSPGPQLRRLYHALARCRDRFRAIQVNRGERKPLIGIVGEIFCRLNSFANQDVARRLEAYGAEVWIAGFSEWVWYANAEELRNLRLRRRRLSWRAAKARLRNCFQRRDEKALTQVLAAELAGRPDPDIAEVLEAARPYLPPGGALGEMVLNVGNVPCFARRGVDGIVDISPFTCMNGVVSEAIYPRVSRDLGGLPIRSLYFDGTAAEADLDLELGVFMEMARAYHRRVADARLPFHALRRPRCGEGGGPRDNISQVVFRPETVL